MRKALLALVIFATLLSGAFAQLGDPFEVKAELVDGQVHVEVVIPTNHYLYAENFKVTDALDNMQQAIEMPEAGAHSDPVTGDPIEVYEKSFTGVYAWEPTAGGGSTIRVSYLGCNDKVCFPPQKKSFEIENPGADPTTFAVDVELVDDQVLLDVAVPAKHYLYAENFKVTDALGNEQRIIELPEAQTIIDPVTGDPKPVFSQSFKAIYAWEPTEGGGSSIHVQYWGCNDRVCFAPQTKVLSLSGSEALTMSGGRSPSGDSAPADWEVALENFSIAGTLIGYVEAKAFVEFLDSVESGAEVVEESSGFKLFLKQPDAFLRKHGVYPVIFFILIGGLALNLTPCVLPMIPVNLAIIGAGAQAGSKGRGFALGATYGVGIALVYGLLGVIAVLTGSQFGTIQSNPWFNLVIALIFVVLALAMFDLVHIDFSRFQSKLDNAPKKNGSFLVALSMGSVAALLAGACVAPVVIAVLFLAGEIYKANPVAGFLLPFVLGIGMALPWPFAGAGLSFLPKPGKWMQYIKYAFGVGIIVFAFHFAHLSYRGFNPAEVENGIDGRTNAGFAEALQQSYEADLPVFIDFTASWCKNCKAMEKTTFVDEEVKAKLEGYTFIRYVAEDFDHPQTKAVMNAVGAEALPTFVVLVPKSADR